MTAPLPAAASAAPASAPAPAHDERPQLRVLDTARAQWGDRHVVRLVAGAVVAIVAACVFGVVVAHVVLTQNQFRLDELQTQSTAGQAEYDRLRLEVAELESPNRIVATAQQRLGMVAPPRITYLAPSAAEMPTTSVPAAASTEAVVAPSDGGWSTVKPHLADG